MLTSIIILTYNNLDYTKKCIESIRKNTKKGEYEIVIVDNCSSDGTREWLEKQNDMVLILNEENMGFPKGCNQGIEASSGDNILLLNNDVIVTHNWLDNMIKCLYSSKDIGAVGPVSNSVSYYQQITTSYSNLKELEEFAKEYNVSDSSKWENRLKLVGFCMLIKKKVLDKVGLLDEIFTPGNFEDDDLSLRIVSAGYKLVLCNDTFIHHYGSKSFNKNRDKYIELMMKNEKKINDKLGVPIVHVINIRKDITSLIDEDKEKEFNVLQLECGGCGTLMDIKNRYSNCRIFGTEVHEKALVNRSLDVNIDIGDIENTCFNYELGMFDYIIGADLECGIRDLIGIVGKFKRYLKRNGKFIITLDKNTKNVKNILNMLFVDFNREKINGYVSHNQYIFVLQRKELDENIDSIESNIEIDKNIQKIINDIKSDDKELNSRLEYIYKYSYKGADILNSIGVKMFEEGLIDFVIPVFQTVLKFEPANKDAVLNLVIILSKFKQYDLALKYIDKLYVTDDEIYAVRKDILEQARNAGVLQQKSDIPLISICIPTYNRAGNLKKCLNSIFRQIKTWMNIEVVIVNNDSPDNTEEVVMSFKNKYDNIIYIKNENNIGGDKNILYVPTYANGQFVFLHGDDDYFMDGSLVNVYNFVKDNTDNSFIFFQVTKNDKSVKNITSVDEFVAKITGTSSAFMSSIMMKKCFYDELKDKEKFIDSGLNQIYILLSILECYPKACIINYSLFYYENNLSGGYNWPKVFIENYLNLLRYFTDKNVLSQRIYNFEKERVLKQSAIEWLGVFKENNRMKEFHMDTLKHYVDKYYKNEEYYKESYELIDSIMRDKVN